MAILFDIRATIQALKKGEATPEQQRDSACLLILLHNSDSWDGAVQLYLSLKASGLAGEYTPKEKCRPPPTPVPSSGRSREP